MALEVLAYGFMQRAIISGIAIALLCSVVGLFLVLRRYSLFGDAVAHASFGGIAVGLLIGVYPIWTAYIVSLISALVITRIKQRFDISGEASVAVLLSSGIAIGLILISISGGFNVDIFSFLFGSILLVSVEDTVLILGLTGIILIVILLLYRELIYSTFNEEQAKVSGIPVEKINYLIVFIAGITVVTWVFDDGNGNKYKQDVEREFSCKLEHEPTGLCDWYIAQVPVPSRRAQPIAGS